MAQLDVTAKEAAQGESQKQSNDWLLSAEKMFANRYIIAIRRAFTVCLPLIVIGSIAALINNIPVKFIQDLLQTPVGQVIRSFNGAVWLGTTAVLALLILWNMGSYLAKYYGLNETMGGIAAAGSYLATCITTEDGGIALSRLGPAGLFGGMVIAVLATELYRTFSHMKIEVKDNNASDDVRQMFEAIIPVALTVVCITLLNTIIALSGRDISEWLFAFFEFLFSAAKSGGILGALFMVFGIHSMWFFGIHGGNVLDGVMTTAYGSVLQANIEAFAATGNAYGKELAVISKSFLDVFVIMGGAGTTLCAIIAIFIAAKSKYVRNIAKMGSVFAVFNINEIVLFGLPVILSPIMLIPFLGTPLVLTFVSWIAMNTGIVARVVADVHWAMPPIISGYIATGGNISGSILQVVNIVIGVLIYMPFVRMLDRRIAHREEKDDQRLENALFSVVDKVRGSTSEINSDIAGFAAELKKVSDDLGQVSGDAGRQMDMLHTSTDAITSVSETVSETHDSVTEVLENAENTIKLSQDGTKTMSEATKSMQDIYDATNNMNTITSQLVSRCSEIENILRTIEGISSRTNILSLNATIEAARAGEAGKGFAVVAQNVRSLAEATAEAVHGVADLLHGMAEDVNVIEQQCRNSFEIVRGGQAQISGANTIFGDIIGSVRDVRERCNTVLSFSDRVEDELSGVRGHLLETNEFFGSTATNTTEVADKMEETSHAAVMMVERLRSLNEEIDKLANDVLNA